MTAKQTVKSGKPHHGPYKVVFGREDRNEMSRITKVVDSQFIVAYVIREHQNKLAQADDDATALLLAASPDLLAVCELIVDLAAKGKQIPSSLVAAAESAIAKAKGEKP